MFFKKKFRLKHFIIVLFIGLNSSLSYAIYLSLLIFLLLIVFKKLDYLKLKNLIVISCFFYLSCILSHINIIYSIFFEGPFHRSEILNKLDSSDLFIFLKEFFHLDPLFLNDVSGYVFSKNIHLTIFLIFFTPLIFIAKDKKLHLIFFLHVCLGLFIFFFKSLNLDFLRFWNPLYYIYYNVIIYSLIALFLLSRFNSLKYLLIIVTIISEINSSMVPFAKKYISPFKDENYRNYYTFNGYYLKETYSLLKNEVQNKKVLSLQPLDPMVAVMNGIKSIDGCHNLYPLNYKKKFYKIIEKELNNNNKLRDYYLNWGHRVNAFVNDASDIQINFLEAKKLGADYVLSKYPINNKLLSIKLFIDNKGIIYLYKINT